MALSLLFARGFSIEKILQKVYGSADVTADHYIKNDIISALLSSYLSDVKIIPLIDKGLISAKQ